MDSFVDRLTRNRILRWALFAPAAIVVYFIVDFLAGAFLAFGNGHYGIYRASYSSFLGTLNNFFFFDMPALVAACFAAGYVAVATAPLYKRETWLVFSAVVSTLLAIFILFIFIAVTKGNPKGAPPWWFYLNYVAEFVVQCASLFGGGYKAYKNSLS